MRYSALGYIDWLRQDVDANLVIGSPHGFHLKITTLTSGIFWVSPKNMVRPWQMDRYLFLHHVYRYKKARDVPLVFVSYVSTWS